LANILDKFKESVIGSNKKIADYTSVISPKGDFTRITGFDVILNSWNTILNTPIGTYDHDPEFGCDLYKYLFELCDDTTRDGIIFTIKNQLLKYDDRATIESIDVRFTKDLKGFIVDVVASYMGENGQITISVQGVV
jgi:phage baseplate assembly protein W